MTEIVRATTDDWERLRDVRLRALDDAPDAFGSTLEREAAYGRDDWLGWLSGWGGAENAVFAVDEDRRWLGIAVGSHRPGDEVAHVYAMWVEPRARGRALGRRLLDAVVAWARDRGAAAVELGVTEGNVAADALYRGAGFEDTGTVESLREGSPLTLRVLRRALEA